jgi:hypothetical protein|nr:MAG TPA: hypothetical protein [Caudoviricetes sp.]
MNLDKYIRMALTNLSKKYKITIVEITFAKEEKINKNYTVSYEELNSEKINPQKIVFKNKKALVSWLLCLK